MTLREANEIVWEAKMLGKYAPREGESIIEAANRILRDKESA